MLIGELATRTGVSTKTLRFYEQRGLLHAPARTPGGYRDYDDAACERVRFIRRAQGAGLTLRQIGEVLTIRDGGQAPCAHVSRSVAEQLDQVEARLTELERTREDLHALQDRLGHLDVADCSDDAICAAITTAL